MYKFEKQFRKETPQFGRANRISDLENYKDWLEKKLIASNTALTELAFQVKQCASGDADKMYFRDELKNAEKALVQID